MKKVYELSVGEVIECLAAYVRKKVNDLPVGSCTISVTIDSSPMGKMSGARVSFTPLDEAEDQKGTERS